MGASEVQQNGAEGLGVSPNLAIPPKNGGQGVEHGLHGQITMRL